jgi:hypothetical protein
MHDAHASGLHMATELEWRRLLARVANLADVIGVTERPPVGVFPGGWDASRSSVRGAECVIGWNPNRVELASFDGDCEGAAVLTDRTFYTGAGAERPGVVATWVLLRLLVSRLEVLRLVAHFPASVQRGDGFSTNVRRALAWRAALKGLRTALLELVDDLDPDELVVSCDFNVDLRRRHWRVLINHGLRGTGVRVKAPTEGTHGARAIDGHASTMRRRDRVSRVLRRSRGFDHRPVVAEFKENRT